MSALKRQRLNPKTKKTTHVPNTIIPTLPLDFTDAREISRGTFSVVMEATYKGKRVAVKKQAIAPQTTPYQQELHAATLLRETNAMRVLGDHPNIMSCSDAFYDDLSEGYIVMEKKRGTLHMVIQYFTQRSKRIDISATICMFKKLAGAVHHAHTNNIIHSDIKPANILADGKEWSIWLSDWGSSRTCTNKIGLPNTCERVTLWYRAPELLRNLPVFNSAIDIWSLGCILFEMIIGTPVFQGKDVLTQYEAIKEVVRNPNHVYWTHVPHSLKNLLTQMLIMDPRHRIDAEKIVQELENM